MLQIAKLSISIVFKLRLKFKGKEREKNNLATTKRQET